MSTRWFRSPRRPWSGGGSGSGALPARTPSTSSWSSPLVANPSPRSKLRRPSKSVIRPPASSTRTIGAARSHGCRSDLDHRLGRPLGDQRVAPEVAEPALAPDRAEQAPEARGDAATRRCRGRSRRGPGHRSRPRRATRGRAAAPASSPAAATHAPPPRLAYQRSPSAGALDDAGLELAVALDARAASRTAGTPRMKLWVPSIGSMYQRVAAGAGLGRRTPRRRGRGPGSGRRSGRGSSRSIAVSASVTNDRRACVSIVEVARGTLRGRSASASSQVSRANASHPRARPATPRRSAADQSARRRRTSVHQPGSARPSGPTAARA